MVIASSLYSRLRHQLMIQIVMYTYHGLLFNYCKRE